MSGLDRMAREAGFRDEREYHNLVAAVELIAAGAYEAFVKWKNEDGTKAGLLAAFPYLRG